MTGKELLMSDLRGSLGGLTASRNRWGNYLRARVTPIQPNTPAQLGAKTSFGASASIWRSLTAVERQLFNSFAKATFQPRSRTNTGKYTGQQAFSALWTQYQNSLRLNRTFTILKNGVVLPGGFTTLPFSGPIVSGLRPLLGTNFVDSTNVGLPSTITDAKLDQSGICEFTIQLGNGSTNNFVEFNLENVGRVGFAMYCSSANPIQGMAFRNHEKYLLGYTERAQFVVPADGDNAINFTLQFTAPLPVIDYQSFPVGSEYVLLSVYAVADSNQMKLLGRHESVVSSIP